MSDFLPTKYEVPQKSGSYMRLQEGENRIRILCSPIIGWETWDTTPEGGRKPRRTPMDKPFDISQVSDPENVKHFWAMAVWNYAEEKVQILEITQKGIQKTIRALAKDEDWGSPVNFDLVITREGKDLNTTYQVQPKPAKKIDTGITRLYEDMHINLQALFTGDDPFSESVNPDDVPDNL